MKQETAGEFEKAEKLQNEEKTGFGKEKAASKISKKMESITLWVLSLFYVLSLETITMIQYTAADPVFRYGRFACYMAMIILFGISVAGTNRKAASGRIVSFIMDHPFYWLVVLLSVIVSINTGGIEPLVMLLLFSLVRTLPLPAVFRQICLTTAVFFCAIVFLSLSGVIDNLVFWRQTTPRFSLGFMYPLECMSLFFFWVLIFLYIRFDHLKWTDYALIGALDALLYYLTRSRFSAVLVLCVLVLVFFARRYFERLSSFLSNRNVRLLLCFAVLLFFLVPVLAAWQYRWGNMIFDTLNKAFNDRLVLGKKAFERYPLSWFGQTIVWVGYGGLNSADPVAALKDSYNYLDCSYLKNLFDTGYLYYAFECGMYMWTVFRASKKHNLPLLIILFMTLCAGIYEPRLLQVSVNLVLPACAGFVFIPLKGKQHENSGRHRNMQS